ncbi:MAG TPA: PBPRA1643 family SWIM/SEC-C metal-binding motif protein [Anaeromyxobacteraceae bacterium]|nr:PBPRA1643 family SWIM/SEC-C metal-binding motif protein [Anaeromyxobacteraceae bacterium]
MPKIGTETRPAILRVQTDERMEEIVAICRRRGVRYLIEVDPDRPEDVAELTRALQPPEPVVAAPRVGRNDPCPCGSGKKLKKCCGGPPSA